MRIVEKFLAGFTLIETMVTIFVLVVVIIAILQMFPLGIRIGQSAQMATIASELGQAKIEEIISSSYDEVSVGTIEPKHQLDSPFERYSRQTIVTCVDPNLQPVACDYDLDENPHPLKKIGVTVFWTPPFGVSEKSTNIISLLAKR